jgi:hypothetical protein
MQAERQKSLIYMAFAKIGDSQLYKVQYVDYKSYISMV